MKKYLIILLCLVGLSGCVMIYPSSITHEGYFLPAKPQLYTDLNDEFDNECQDISEYIVESAQNQNLKQYLIDRGADCDTTENVCYFYFVRDNEDNYNSIIDINMVYISYFDLINKIYASPKSVLDVKIPFDKKSKNAIKTNYTQSIFNACGKMNYFREINLETKFQQKVKDIINAN